MDDLPAVWEASNHVFRKSGVTPLTLEEFRAEFRLPYHGFYQKFVPHVAPAQLEAWFHERFAECQESVVPLPHARELLEFCAHRSLRIFLFSAVHERHLGTQIEATGFRPYFERVYGGIAEHFPVGAMMEKGLTIKTGQTHVQKYLPQLLEMIGEDKIDTTYLISHRLPLEDAPKGYKRFKERQNETTKVVLKPDWERAAA